MSREIHTMNRIVSSKPRRFIGRQAGFRIGQWRNEGAKPVAAPQSRAASSASDAVRIRQRQAYEAMPEGNLKRGGR